MSDAESPAGSPANEPVDDGQEREFEEEVAAADSDRDSDLLSEVDEDQFEDYDPETANIEDRPVDIDEDAARTLKASKRKRAEGEAARKPREGRREKKRRDRDDDVAMDNEADATERHRSGDRDAPQKERGGVRKGTRARTRDPTRRISARSRGERWRSSEPWTPPSRSRPPPRGSARTRLYVCSLACRLS